MSLQRILRMTALVAAVVTLAACASPSPAAALTVSGAWVRSLAAPNTPSAAYMTIKNDGATDDRLLSVTSDSAATVEMHQTDDMNGMMSMSALPDLPVLAHGQTVLAPGGTHLMLIGVSKPLKTGDKVVLTLKFDKAGTLTVSADVRDQ
jgi:copper(I)-binding protein